jgi:putative oxidoreductase
MSAVFLIGRILFALIFLNSGVMHFTKSKDMIGYAKYKKVPAAPLAVLLSGLMILVGAVLIILGVWVDLGNLLIAAFALLSAFMMHNFWTVDDAAAKQTETISFFKNLSMAGSALIILALVNSNHAVYFGPIVGHHLVLFTTN